MELAKGKRRHFLYRLFCPKEIFFKICVLSQCILYWIHVQNLHTFTYQKHYCIHFSCLFLKSSKAFSVSLRSTLGSRIDILWIEIILRSSRPEVFCKKGVLKKITILTRFTGKRLHQSLFFDKVEGLRHTTLFKKRIWHRCIPVNITKFLRTPILKNIYGRMLLGNSRRQQGSYFHNDVLYISFTFILKHFSCIKLFIFWIENLLLTL